MADVEFDVSEDHQLLQHKLHSIVEQARENEAKLQRFQEQELNIIGARTLPDLINNVLYNYRRAFALDTVTLVIIDTDYEIRHILEDEGVRLNDHPGLIFAANQEFISSLFGSALQPQLGAFHHDRHKHVFNLIQPSETPLQSVSLLPLVRGGALIGSLNLGSFNRERFSASSATDFLNRLATIVAICIENATNIERLKRVGLTDPLTSISNRRFFDQRLFEEIGRSIRSNEPISCLFIDIDHFKLINDRYGHHVGDQVLREVAKRIRTQLRSCDVIARYGGEEFAILLVNTLSAIALEVAERIRHRIDRQEFEIPDTQTDLRVTVSIGVSTLESIHGMEDSPLIGKSLLETADHALYVAKSDGRNCVVLQSCGQNDL